MLKQRLKHVMEILWREVWQKHRGTEAAGIGLGDPTETERTAD